MNEFELSQEKPYRTSPTAMAAMICLLLLAASCNAPNSSSRSGDGSGDSRSADANSSKVSEQGSESRQSNDVSSACPTIVITGTNLQVGPQICKPAGGEQETIPWYLADASKVSRTGDSVVVSKDAFQSSPTSGTSSAQPFVASLKLGSDGQYAASVIVKLPLQEDLKISGAPDAIALVGDFGGTLKFAASLSGKSSIALYMKDDKVFRSAVPTKTAAIIEHQTLFVTSQAVPTNFAGNDPESSYPFPIADQKCQDAASAGGLHGAFKAIFSSLQGDSLIADPDQGKKIHANSRHPVRGPVYRPDGVLLAKDFGDFWDGSLLALPIITESRLDLRSQAVGQKIFVISGSSISGAMAPDWAWSNTCYSWTLGVSNDRGDFGDPTRQDWGWMTGYQDELCGDVTSPPWPDSRPGASFYCLSN